MSTSVTGEQFIRTLRHYLEANEHRLLSSQPNFTSITDAGHTVAEPESIKEESGLLKAVSSLWTQQQQQTTEKRRSSTQSSTSSRPTSHVFPYMSLLAAASPNATSLSNTPYMPLRSSLTLDIHYLYFLLVQFEYLGLEDTQLPVPEEHGLVETETTQSAGKAPSIASSISSVMSTLSLSTGWQLWSKQAKQERPLHEDIVFIHRYFSRVTALKLHMSLDTQNGVTRSGQRVIRGYEKPIPLDGSLALPLHSFKNLSYLELNHIHPSTIESWPTLSQQLISLVLKNGHVDDAADVIGDREWPQLKMLSLADNSITTLEAEPVQHIRSVTHLNLSSNLLIDVPAALSALYNLCSLNLSYNMISFTTGINTVLGNIQELDLRGNRLTLLAGLDRLWALERLDVRDNRIDDAAEIGRLTSLPNIYDIWVEGNPFTKVQPDYRVNIFSMFKKCDLDIELDGSKPTFVEKRRITSEPMIHNSTPPAAVQSCPDHSKENNEHNTKLARAKSKGNKRMIRLGQNAIDPPTFASNVEPGKHVHRLAELEDSVQQDVASTATKARRAASVKSKRSKAPVEDGSKPKTDAFRKKIEAMRKEAGTEWLRVLQEMDIVKEDNKSQ